MRARNVFAAALVAGLAALGCGKKDPDPPAVGGPPGAPVPPVPAAAPNPDADKEETVRRLKQIGLAFHNFESATLSFPAGVVGPNGNLGLSWRVALLPYLEQGALYKEFKLNEPWDGEHNKKLVAKMPRAFAHPARPAGEGKTHFRALAGHDAFLPLPAPWVPEPNFAALWRAAPGFPALGRPMSAFSDGTSSTLMVAEAADPVEWTKPDELVYQDEVPKTGGLRPGPVPKFGGAFADGFHALMCDGRVHFFPTDLKPDVIRALVTVNRGEVIDGPAAALIWGKPPQGAGAPPPVPGQPKTEK